jgi:hypothetical protein
MSFDKESRRQAIKDYKSTPPEIGVYAIKNTEKKKVFIGGSLNLNGPLGRHVFELRMGNHKCTTMQEDFKTMGEEAFTFEKIDTLKRKEDDPYYDYKPDLVTLEEIWMEKFRQDGWSSYKEDCPGVKWWY